jgi:hypothetical protein
MGDNDENENLSNLFNEFILLVLYIKTVCGHFSSPNSRNINIAIEELSLLLNIIV